jgi:hypothetical protein
MNARMQTTLWPPFCDYALVVNTIILQQHYQQHYHHHQVLAVVEKQQQQQQHEIQLPLPTRAMLEMQQQQH